MSKYDGLSKSQLVALLEKHDRTKKLGLVWERDEILADNAIDENFVAATLDVGLSDKPAPWRNLVIEGDNFDSLRWLRMTHAGQIKCIYVDPPYNTGNKDWVYNDRYFDSDDRYRFSTWLEFLYRRFTLARDLLTEDGVILVSINDENRALLELMLEEALPGMRLGSLTWRSRTGGNEGGESFLSKNHEHILLFGRSGFRFSGTKKSYEDYTNPDDDPRGDWQSDNLTQSKTAVERENSYFPICDPKTNIFYPCNPDGVWRYTSKALSPKKTKIRTKFIEEWIELEQILFPKDQRVETWGTKDELLAAIDAGDVPRSGKTLLIDRGLPDVRISREETVPALDYWVGKPVGFGTPRFKRFQKDLKNPNQPLSSWIIPNSEAQTKTDNTNEIVSGTTDEGSKAIKRVFGSKAFNYPKPPSLLKELIKQASSPNDIVLDFFAGSATTAQAVMELNAEDHGDRRFIMASSTEVTEDEPDKNICRDITAERVRLLNKSDDKKYADLAAEFAYLKTREIPFDAFDDELRPQEVWSALEALHGLPLTEFEVGGSWNEHATEAQVIIYADAVDKGLMAHIQKHVDARANLFVYSWAPGQIELEFPKRDFEVRSVRDTLIKRFQQ